jgi:hypothetical protein
VWGDVKADTLFEALSQANSAADAEAAIAGFEEAYGSRAAWQPVGGRPNNRGVIEVSADPGRALVERVTNAIDAVLELEHERRRGIPVCRSPKEAASAWLNVPEGGLSELTPGQRRGLAQQVVVSLSAGESRDAREARVVVIRDLGIGLTPEQMPSTILSLNESNKIQKHYLAGTYGQGGSSTFAVSKYTLIASRSHEHGAVGFTVVRYLDLPADEYKTGRYVYLTLDGAVLQVAASATGFEPGTLVRHIGYDLSRYPSPLGPNSIYGLLNEVLFDPVLPVWLHSQLHGYRRVIKGARNALNGAVDEGDPERRGPKLSHSVKLYYVTLGDFGRIGIEYWVLESPTKENKRPIAAFVSPSRPILLTLHGQTHAELSQLLIRKGAEFPYLTHRLICHIDCNHLTPEAKRALFVSNREDARRGIVYEMMEQELIKALKSDDELTRLNNEARQRGQREGDETVRQQMRKEVARLLHIHGLNVTEPIGAEVGGTAEGLEKPVTKRGPRPKPQPIDLHEPPTFLRLVWPEGEPITFYAEQRRYVRIETDAHSSYHDPNHPENSRINFALSGDGLRFCGSTPLQGGRLRAILEGTTGPPVGTVGMIRVELARPGLPVLADERPFQIVQTPPVREGKHRVSLPPFEVRPVDGPDDPMWSTLDWPDDENSVAFSSQMENGQMVVYYSTAFPRYAGHRLALERKDVTLAASFTKRYEIWVAVHSFLMMQDEQAASEGHQLRELGETEVEALETRERQERCRVATLAALFAAREVRLPIPADAEAGE